MKKSYKMTFHTLTDGAMPRLHIECKRGAVCTPRRVADVVAEFAKHGVTVSAEAITHNWEAWALEEKSGFNDDLNGIHVFTPYGDCNDLSFTIFPIKGMHTYTC